MLDKDSDGEVCQTTMRLGAKVVSKRTGYPGVGYLAGVILPNFYGVKYRFDYWDRLYPGWRNKLVYFVYYEEERKPLTMEEYISCVGDSTENRENYSNIRNANLIAYPECDLELFGD